MPIEHQDNVYHATMRRLWHVAIKAQLPSLQHTREMLKWTCNRKRLAFEFHSLDHKKLSVKL